MNDVSGECSNVSSIEADTNRLLTSITTQELNVKKYCLEKLNVFLQQPWLNLVLFYSIKLPSDPEPDNFVNNGNSGLKTLNLKLDEVAHIRAALTKAELEAIDSKLREEIEKGKVLKHLLHNIASRSLQTETLF